MQLSTLEIALHLFSPIYSTTMLNDRNEAFTALKTDVPQTGVNVYILHVK